MHRSTFDDLGFSKVDLERERRTGYPEVIFGQGKTVEQVDAIFAFLIRAHGRGVTAVNIDNGFGAGYSAAMIQQLVWEATGK